jgi:hypothetical protein
MTPPARKNPRVGGAVWTRAPATSSRQIGVHGAPNDERFFGDGDDTEQEEDDDDDDGAKEEDKDNKEGAADEPPKKR